MAWCECSRLLVEQDEGVPRAEAAQPARQLHLVRGLMRITQGGRIQSGAQEGAKQGQGQQCEPRLVVETRVRVEGGRPHGVHAGDHAPAVTRGANSPHDSGDT